MTSEMFRRTQPVYELPAEFKDMIVSRHRSGSVETLLLHQRFQTSLRRPEKLERICRDEGQNLAESSCGLKPNKTTGGLTYKCWRESLTTDVNVIFYFVNTSFLGLWSVVWGENITSFPWAGCTTQSNPVWPDLSQVLHRTGTQNWEVGPQPSSICRIENTAWIRASRTGLSWYVHPWPEWEWHFKYITHPPVTRWQGICRFAGPSNPTGDQSPHWTYYWSADCSWGTHIRVSYVDFNMDRTTMQGGHENSSRLGGRSEVINSYLSISQQAKWSD